MHGKKDNSKEPLPKVNSALARVEAERERLRETKGTGNDEAACGGYKNYIDKKHHPHGRVLIPVNRNFR
jgi:hypothetical protein